MILGHSWMIIKAVFQPDMPDRAIFFGAGTFVVLVDLWAFLLLVGGPKAAHAGVPYCSACGALDAALCRTKHRVCFCLFGLIPISWHYKRVLCDRCRKGIIRIGILLENIWSMIFFPVGTILGIVWTVKNLDESNTIDVAQSLELLGELHELCSSEGDQIASHQVEAALIGNGPADCKRQAYLL